MNDERQQKTEKNQEKRRENKRTSRCEEEKKKRQKKNLNRFVDGSMPKRMSVQGNNGRIGRVRNCILDWGFQAFGFVCWSGEWAWCATHAMDQMSLLLFFLWYRFSVGILDRSVDHIDSVVDVDSGRDHRQATQLR